VAYHLAGRDVRADAGGWWTGLTAEQLLRSGMRLGGLAFVLVVLGVAARGVRWARPRLEAALCPRLKEPGCAGALRRGLALLETFAVLAVGLVAAWVAHRVLGLPYAVERLIALAARLLLILAAVRLLPHGARVLVGAAADLGDRYLARGKFRHYWERGRRLVPFGLHCFDAAVYVAAAALALRELAFLAPVAGYGRRVIACIGIFFACRVVIELAQVLLNQALGLYDEKGQADQKGLTLVPLLHSVCQYLVYFGAAVIMLGVLGVNTAPILAGAGLVGLAIGLGAQSLVTDVVSGFFILFEGQYLVGDLVQIGEATGRVEAVSIRHTQVRDAGGKLHIIPNGQIKEVVNASRGYLNAVVELRLPAEGDLDALLDAMREAGRRLRREHADDVLADTEVQGLVDLGPSEMTSRAVTRVRPGAHAVVESEYRRLVKQVLDERRAAGRPREAA
jgi:small conductance mechanosensitive channel